MTIQQTSAQSRQARVRAKLKASGSKPRLHLFRSNRYLYAQIIDDDQGKTLVAASEKELKIKGTKTQRAAALGTLLGKKATKIKLKTVRFDRGPNRFHGRLKTFATAARQVGLEF